MSAAKRGEGPARTSGRTREHAARYARHLRALVPLDGPVAALRLAFYLGGLACFGVSPVGAHLHLPRNSLVMSASLIAGLICFFVACRATVPHLLGWLLPYGRGLAVCGLLGTLWLSFYSFDDIVHFPRDLGRPNHSWTDAIAMTDCAAHLVLRGRNPYADVTLVGCFSSLHLDGRFSTPLQAGAFAHVGVQLSLQEELRAFDAARRHHVRHPAEFESYFNYPAGAFLLAAPVVALDWPEFSASYMVWIVAAYLLLAWRAPPRLRPWLVPLALGNVAFWDYVMRGFTEGSMVFLLLAAWITRRRPVVSAVLMGAAVATHQEAWPFALFYLVWSGRSDGRRAAAWRLAVIVAMFALVNGPFAVQSPGDWVDGVLGPLKDPMFPAGAGVIALGRHGLQAPWPHPVYTLLELAALVACILYYARTCGRQPDTGLVLALVPLVFAWRSFFVYFFAPLPLLCLWPVLADLARTPREPSRGDGLESGAKVPDAGGRSSLGDAVDLLGVGEALHGGEDILLLRNRLFQRLVEAHGYSAIAIESSFPRARVVNEYVAGRGPASYEAVQETGFGHGFGRLDAKRELVEWMRRHNADPFASPRSSHISQRSSCYARWR